MVVANTFFPLSRFRLIRVEKKEREYVLRLFRLALVNLGLVWYSNISNDRLKIDGIGCKNEFASYQNHNFIIALSIDGQHINY